mgnify:CR=1 FL=1
MKTKITVYIAVLISLSMFSQETTTEDNTIDYQFRTLYKNSNNYQEYKVVKKVNYGNLHNNVLDSIKQYRAQLKLKNNLINNQKLTISKLEKDNKDVNLKLQTSITKENSISLLGIQLTKSNYSILLFTIIVLLIVGLATFIYKFKNSNIITTEAKSNLYDVEQELNLFRKKSLEKEQKLRRQLQDEINKNRNNS